MQNGVNLAVRASIRGNYTNEQGVVPENAAVAVSREIDFLVSAGGAGQFQADLLYSQALALGPSGTETLNLQALVDALGQTVNFARVKAIYLDIPAYNANGVTQLGTSVTIAGGASNPFVGPLAGTTPSETVNAGGMTLHVASDPTAWAVASGTANMKLTNNSSTAGVVGTLIILGSAE